MKVESLVLDMFGWRCLLDIQVEMTDKQIGV